MCHGNTLKPVVCACLLIACLLKAETPVALRLGIASHAFDHLGNIGEQANAATASGSTIIYNSGLGALGYQGLPDEKTLSAERLKTGAYVRDAKSKGIKLAIGYVCATSIVKLDTFDKNWSPKFRAKFHAPVGEWRQQNVRGEPLPSWYGGDYQPACMNNPDWRTYERFLVRQQLEAGCDGIFFDNPTVHPEGCYCPHCMERFRQFLAGEQFFSTLNLLDKNATTDELRKLAVRNPQEFLKFRGTISRDFFSEMRSYARTVKRDALITANNSLNSSGVLYSQSQTYGYNIFEMSKAEDFVVVEDMSSQPRTLSGGQTIEYTPTYKQLHAISHGKPVVAVTIAEADYHTPPNLVRLAMAEAAANGASYLSWPTWPENERARMIFTIRPQADFLRQNEKLLNETRPRNDVIVFLPFRRWLETNVCAASAIAAELSRANVQYDVVSEENLEPGIPAKIFSKELRLGLKRIPPSLEHAKVFLAESPSVLTETEMRFLKNFERAGGRILFADSKGWFETLTQALPKPSMVLKVPPTVRAVVRDQSRRTLVHLLNLNVERISSFQDKVHSATNIQISVTVPFEKVRSVRALTADADATTGSLEFSITRDRAQTVVRIIIPRLEIATLLVLEP